MIPQAPRWWYLHRCRHCGCRIRRHRQNTQAAWYVRNGLDPKPWPIRWCDDKSGSDRCYYVTAERPLTGRAAMGDQAHEPEPLT